MSTTTRSVRVGRSVVIGGGAPIVVQSMCATKTRDVDATVAQAAALQKAGAGIVRIACDSEAEAEALASIRRQVTVALSVDLQENYRLAEKVAPHVDKIRYNPGHLYHLEREKPVEEKVAFVVRAAREHGCAVRIGVNCGSVDPVFHRRYPEDSVQAMVESAVQHCAILDRLSFAACVVSLKDSDPKKVIEGNRRFAARRPDVPIHLGLTEAGMPPGGVIRSRLALEPLLAAGIGDTLRISLTLPNERKPEEVTEGLRLIEDVKRGRFTAPPSADDRLVIISCPSCSRVENDRFVDLAEKVRAATAYAKPHDITIAVMGCRVNGPGETDDADLGLWCGPAAVNLKRKGETLGSFGYDEVLGRLKRELDALIAARTNT
jgi:(E)-4-hydroxy-3-methylbut-2-enyl-diphosphate synthase